MLHRADHLPYNQSIPQVRHHFSLNPLRSINLPPPLLLLLQMYSIQSLLLLVNSCHSLISRAILPFHFVSPPNRYLNFGTMQMLRIHTSTYLLLNTSSLLCQSYIYMFILSTCRKFCHTDHTIIFLHPISITFKVLTHHVALLYCITYIHILILLFHPYQ